MFNAEFNLSRIRGIITSAACIVAVMIMPCLSLADNAVDVGITSNDQHDTLWATFPSTVDFFFANDVLLGGMSISFEFFSPDGATWHWDGGSYFFSFVPGSRMPGPQIWDMAGGAPIIYDADGISPDTIMFGGSAMSVGLAPGPLEHMLSYHLTVDIPDDEGIYEFCVDSLFIPPAGAFVFVDIIGNAMVPTTLWETGGACWPVEMFQYICGDANFDGMVNVGDIVFIIAYVFTGGPAPDPYCQGDVNGNGHVQVDDAVYLINYIFKGGSPPLDFCCP